MTFELAINPNVLAMEYAVRGPIPQRAAELRRDGREIIFCNIGNPQALGQQPISYYRQVLNLLENPFLVQRERRLNRVCHEPTDAGISGLDACDFYSDYILDLAEDMLRQFETGLGAYSESQGPLFIRRAIADFIDQRDAVSAGGGVASDPQKIYLINGASEGARFILEMLIAQPTDGIMIPIPQYPLYSATIRKLGGVQVNYYPDEDRDWSLDKSPLNDARDRARKAGVTVKAIVVINPGNPTGAILDRQSMIDVIDFARENNCVIIADEVYQENVYGAEFVSFARMIGDEPIPLCSLHSISKGFYGECGHRGGYLEVRNPPQLADTTLKFTDVLVKQASVNLCPNTVGQALTYLMVRPPEKGSPPHTRFIEEKRQILEDLLAKATMVREAFTHMTDMECFGRTGAMYLFPRMNRLPAGTTDFDYCMALLEKTGLCTVNGSGFGQKKGTHHLRIAFLPPRELLTRVLPQWIDFHNDYVSRG